MQSLLFVLLTFLPSQLPSGANDTNDESHRASVAASAKEFVGRCEFGLRDAGQPKFQLHPEPILRWSNPTAGEVFGDVFIWTDNGRPLVVGCWYRWFSPDWGRTFEVCSLADRPLTGLLSGTPFWNCDKPGLSLKDLHNAEPPAKTRAARLVQMRRIAGDFAAHLNDTRNTTAGVKRQLRMLTQPVVRYPTPNEKSKYADGALFAFVEGTDPEAFLVVEADEVKGELRWQFGLARMNRDALRITYRDKDVWSAPFIEQVEGRTTEPYSLFFKQELLSSEPVVGTKSVAPTKKVKP